MYPNLTACFIPAARVCSVLQGGGSPQAAWVASKRRDWILVQCFAVAYTPVLNDSVEFKLWSPDSRFCGGKMNPGTLQVSSRSYEYFLPPAFKHTLLLPSDPKGEPVFWVLGGSFQWEGELMLGQLLCFFPLFTNRFSRKIKIIVSNSTAPIPKSLPSKTSLKIFFFLQFFSGHSTRLLWACSIPYLFIWVMFLPPFVKTSKKEQSNTKQTFANICFLLGGACCCFSCFFPLKYLVTS